VVCLIRASCRRRAFAIDKRTFQRIVRFRFFGLGSVGSAAAMLPGASALILDGDGFETKALFRRRRSRWRDTTGFTVISIPKAYGRF